jgi:Cu-Zn family superoxide dismutase
MKKNKLVFILFVAFSCPLAQANIPIAKAKVLPKNGSQAKGNVEFAETPNGVRIHYRITGLQPNTLHGFHIHENGDCSSPDGKSAGEHYLKTSSNGGTSLDAPEKHAGDLPQIKADSRGIAKGEFEVPDLSISKIDPIENRSIIVHEGPDNPEKPSSPRIACGIIKGK